MKKFELKITKEETEENDNQIMKTYTILCPKGKENLIKKLIKKLSVSKYSIELLRYKIKKKIRIEKLIIQYQHTFIKTTTPNTYDIDLLPRITLHQHPRYDKKIEFSINFHWIIWQYQIYFLKSKY